MKYGILLLITITLVTVNLSWTKDIPCNVREAVAGYVCVCNETYCDTINSPKPLQRGHYYHYKTSKLTPGFTKTKGKFINHTVSEGTYSNISSDVHIWINSNIQYQKCEGFGASLTDNAGSLFNVIPSGARLNLINSFFGDSGIEYNFIRLPIGAADFSPRYYTYDDVPGDVDLKYFNLTEEDFTIKIPLIKMAENVSSRGIKVLATSWTSPAWMKTNNGSRAGYIISQYMGVWAKYLLKFLEAYNDNGISIWALTMGNEVILPVFFGSFFPIANTMWLPGPARNFMKTYLGPMLKESKFSDLKVFMLDDERPFMTWYSDRIFSDIDAAQYVDGIALHWYFDTDASIPMLGKFRDSYPDKMILYTESSINSFQSGGGPVNLGDWSRGIRYAESVFQTFNHWVNSYMDWNIVLNTNGGPTGPFNMTLDASVIVNETSGEFYKQPIYFILGHFSKFISPGSIRINHTIKQDTYETNEENIFMHSMKKELMMKKFNTCLKDTSPPPPPPQPTGTPPYPPQTTTNNPFPTVPPRPPSNTILAIATTNPDGSHTVIAYNPRENPANLIITDSEMGSFSRTVDPHSMNTFIYW